MLKTLWSRFRKSLCRNLCWHKYAYMGSVKSSYAGKDGREYECPIHFFECKECGHRFIARSSDECYTKGALEVLKLWVNGQIEIEFDEL